MGNIGINLDLSPLINFLENEKEELNALLPSDKGFGLENIARDVGRKSSTNRYYFDLVDKGRGSFTASEELVTFIDKKGKKRQRRKLLAFKVNPSTWVLKVEVGAAPPLRLRQQINRRLKQELKKVMREVLGNRAIPLARDIRTINNMLKERALLIAQEITLANTKQHNTRRDFYKIKAAISLAEGYRIVENK